jgi:hypothetical protein
MFFIIPLMTTAQVDEIKSASRSRSKGSSGSIGSDNASFGGSLFGDLVVNLMFGGIVKAQQQSLSKRHDIPTIVSLDLMLHTAVQPSTYYIVNPRIRGNWGLFSTDFRQNHIIEEDMDGVKTLYTNDWQVLLVNLINTRDVVLRLGGGFMQEAFEARNSFPEWSVAFQYNPTVHGWGGVVEYRGAEVRKEVSGYALYKVFDHKALHGFVSAGVQYQRHYQSINTWGVQGGFVLKVY